MGSIKYITVNEAAKLLDVAKRSIYRYAKRGLLKCKYEGVHTFVAEEDVLALNKGRRDLLAFPLTRDAVAKLTGEVQTLKTQIATCMRILNVKYDAFTFTAPEYDALYKSAEQAIADGWPPHVEEMWADYFVRFRIEDFEKMELATGNKHPWRPFLKLASSMHVALWEPALTDLLGAGKTNLQQVAGVWCMLKEEDPRESSNLVTRESAPSRRLMRKVQKSKRL